MPTSHNGRGMGNHPSITASHDRVWAELAAPGAALSGNERVAIAEELRAARTCKLCAARKSALSASAVPAHAPQNRSMRTSQWFRLTLSQMTMRIYATRVIGCRMYIELSFLCLPQLDSPATSCARTISLMTSSRATQTPIMIIQSTRCRLS